MHRENMIEVVDPLQEQIANTIVELKKKFGETKITVDTIHIIIKEVMELVENFSVPGVKKREYVITIIKELVDDLVENDSEKRLIYEMIDKRILEHTIYRLEPI